MSATSNSIVLCKYRELLRLISRLASNQRSDALSEARSTIRSRRAELNPEEQLKYLKELTSRIAFLRVITPKRPGEVQSGVFVVRDGTMVNGRGDAKGTRMADGTISMDEAVKRNERDFKRFYGAQKPKNILF